jgi:hypothetical protein
MGNKEMTNSSLVYEPKCGESSNKLWPSNSIFRGTNMPPVSVTPAVLVGKFAAGVVDIGGEL